MLKQLSKVFSVGALVLGIFSSAPISATVPTTPPEGAKLYSVITYKGEESIQNVLNGKISATIRKGLRYFENEVSLIDDTNAKVHGTLMIQSVDYIKLDQISEELAAASSGGQSAEQVKAGLVAIYGEEIKKADLTSVHFRLK